MSDDPLRFAPATARNQEPILEVLRRLLPRRGLVLELASGSGEHAVFFARHLPEITWQPSDFDGDALASIAAHAEAAGLANIRTPLRLDATAATWPLASADALVCINMLHISPWTASEGLLRGAARLLRPGKGLFLYGPFTREGRHTAPSNAAFDRSLRDRDSSWGVRDLETLARQAQAQGLRLREVIDMPANNLSVWFERR